MNLDVKRIESCDLEFQNNVTQGVHASTRFILKLSISPMSTGGDSSTDSETKKRTRKRTHRSHKGLPSKRRRKDEYGCYYYRLLLSLILFFSNEFSSYEKYARWQARSEDPFIDYFTVLDIGMRWEKKSYGNYSFEE